MSRPETKSSSYGTEREGPVHEGGLSANGRRFAIVAARFNDFIVEKLIDGAQAALRRAGAGEEDVELYRCPGAMEVPGLARKVADTGKFDGIVCLGAVIRGATPHFDLVVREAAAGVGTLAAEGKIAVAFGVLACDTIEQAVERAGAKAGNRGADAAMVAVEMADLYARIEAEKKVEAVPVSVVPPPATDLPRRK
ncbi:MAG TPA: 6,7-dimethyl-8-ribityllumazine synthase [Polyangia bacterium]|jgi:6,7-dimethyl-8-ribityllumazine synthase